MAGWTDQWGRVQRFFKRFTMLNDAKVGYRGLSSDDYQDDAYAFFVACYHRKDWLQNDPLPRAAKWDVEDFVGNSLNLRLCGDLANGFKHLTLTKPREDASTAVGRRYFKLNFGEIFGSGESTVAFGASYEVIARGVTYDAYMIAPGCVAEWSQYLRDKQLIT